MKSHTRLLVGILLITTVANATGCSVKAKSNKGVEVPSIVLETQIKSPSQDDILESITPSNDTEVVVEESIVTEVQNGKIEEIPTNASNEPILVGSTEKTLKEKLNEYLYDENIDYNLVINTYLNTEYDKRSELENDYLRAIYMLLINSNNSLEVYLSELHTMAVMQQVPMCVPEDIWNEQFGNLLTLLNDYESLFEKFGTLAYFVHDIDCEQTHTFDECGTYTCSDLQEEYKLALTPSTKEL